MYIPTIKPAYNHRSLSRQAVFRLANLTVNIAKRTTHCRADDALTLPSCDEEDAKDEEKDLDSVSASSEANLSELVGPW